MRPLNELIDTSDPALPLIMEWINASSVHCEVLPPSAAREATLSELQVTTRSTMGAIAYETGGLLIDHGWLRILGSGNAKLERTLNEWNKERSSGFLLVADDVVGGFFAINSGALGSDKGALYYWAPDSFAWESLEIGYSDFLQWSLSSDLEQFYSELRWPTWQADLKEVHGDQCFSFYPFLWNEGTSVKTSSRKCIPISEHFALNLGASLK